MDEIEDEDVEDDDRKMVHEEAVETISDHLETKEDVVTENDDIAASDKETDEESDNETSQDDTHASKQRKRIVVMDDSDDEVAPISTAIEKDDGILP